MKKLTTSLFIALCTVLMAETANAQFTDVGVGLMYGSEIEQLGLRVDGVYQINEVFRAVADFGFYLPDETDIFGTTVTTTWWELNLNGNYVFHSDAESGLKAYALAGLNYLNFKVESGGQSNSDNEVGLNVGAGAEYAMGFGNLFAELKFVIGDADQMNIGAGVRFPLGN